MSTFLELSVSLRQEAGLSGTGPSSVTGQTGMDKKCVDWINDSWYEIQSAHTDWKFLWQNDGLVNTVANQRAYDLAGLGFDINYIIRQSPRRRITGEPGSDMWLVWYEYEDFRQTFLFGPTRYGIPNSVTIDPSGQMLLDPVPNQAYEVFFEYYAAPAFMAANTDVPTMPVKFHKAIVYRALMKYASHDGATEVYQDAKLNYEMWERRLEAEQLPVPMQYASLA